MTTYTWPASLKPVTFEMRVMPNERVFRSAFNPAAAQVVDMGGDYWMCTMTLPLGNTDAGGAEIEAFLNRLRGSQNFLSLYHLKRPRPRGTVGAGSAATWTTSVPSTAVWTTSVPSIAVWTAGVPCLRSPVAQFATSCVLNMLPGYTLEPGDLFGLPNGQAVMYVGSSTLVADGNGDMTVEFAPAARSAMGAWGLVTFDRPAVSFRLRDGAAPPVSWRPGMYEGITLDLVEAI